MTSTPGFGLRWQQQKKLTLIVSPCSDQVQADTVACALVRDTLISSTLERPRRRNNTQFRGRLFALLERANSWTVEEVLLGSRLDEEDVLRCDHDLHRRWWSEYVRAVGSWQLDAFSERRSEKS